MKIQSLTDENNQLKQNALQDQAKIKQLEMMLNQMKLQATKETKQ